MIDEPNDELKLAEIGCLFPPRTLFFREEVGMAEGNDGSEYELSALVHDMSPIIRSKQTGKWFHMSWRYLIALAEARGIDAADAAPASTAAEGKDTP